MSEIILVKGVDYEKNFYLRVKKTKAAVDISSYIFKGDIKKNTYDDDSEIIGSFTYSAPFQAVDPNDGETKWFVTRSISKEDIAALGTDCAVTDLFASNDAGATWQPWSGFIDVKRRDKITVIT